MFYIEKETIYKLKVFKTRSSLLRNWCSSEIDEIGSGSRDTRQQLWWLEVVLRRHDQEHFCLLLSCKCIHEEEEKSSSQEEEGAWVQDILKHSLELGEFRLTIFRRVFLRLSQQQVDSLLGREAPRLVNLETIWSCWGSWLQKNIFVWKLEKKSSHFKIN